MESCPVSECDDSQAETGGARNVLLIKEMDSGDGRQVQAVGVDYMLSIVATAHVACIVEPSYTRKKQYSTPTMKFLSRRPRPC